MSITIYEENKEDQPKPIGTIKVVNGMIYADPHIFQTLVTSAAKQGLDPMKYYANWSNGYLTTKEDQ